MSNIKGMNNQTNAILSIIAILIAYAGERLVEIFTEPSRTYAFALMVAMVLAVAIVYLLLSKNNNSFYGLLAALVGYKMLPPSINMVDEVSVTGELAYFIFKKACALIFIYLIIKFYNMQKDNNKIKVVPIVAIMLSVDFFMEIGYQSREFFLMRTGSMLGVYMSFFACYAIAHLVVLFVSYKSNYTSLRFATYYTYMALGINALKRVGAIIANEVMGSHISRSYYAWIAVYAVIAILFTVAKSVAKKKELAK